jgi:PAS domain S-box-containing protein
MIQTAIVIFKMSTDGSVNILNMNQMMVELSLNSTYSNDIDFCASLYNLCNNGNVLVNEGVDYVLQLEELHDDEYMISVSEKQSKAKDYSNHFSELFANMVSGSAIHEIILDDAGKPVDYRILAVNSAFERLTGLNRSDIIGKTVLEVMPETETYWIELYGEVVLSGKPKQFENYSSSLGKYYEVSAFATDEKRFAVVFNDITEIKLREKNLIESDERLNMALDAANSGVWEWDFIKDKCQIDEKLCSIIDCKKDSLVGTIKDLTDLIHPDDVGFIKEEIDQTINYGNIFSTEFRVITDKGELVLQAYAKIIDEENKSKIVGIMIDVTKKRIQEHLVRHNERKAKLIFDNVPVGVVLANKLGDIKTVNKCFCDIVGYSEDEIYDINFSEITHPDYLADELIFLEQLLNDEIDYCAINKKYFRKDKSLVDVALRVSKYIDEETNEVSFLAIIEDISDKMQSEIALRESQQKYELLFQNMSEASAIFDLKYDLNGKLIDTFLVDANKYFVEKIGGLYKIDKETMFGLSAVSSKKFRIHHSFLKIVSEVMASGKPKKFEQGIPIFDPKSYFSSTLYKIDEKRVAIIMEDITEKKSAQDSLIIKDFAVNSALQGIVLADLKGNITFANQAFTRMWGYDNSEDLVGTNIYQFGDLDMIDRVFNEVFSTGGVLAEGKGIKKNGEWFNIQYSINLVKDRELRPMQIMASFIDITDKVAVEEEIRNLNKNLEAKVEKRTHDLNSAMRRLEDQNEELKLLNDEIAVESMKLLELNERLSESEFQLMQAKDAKDKFFSIIAHDIKNPLQNLLLSSEILEQFMLKKDYDKAFRRSSMIKDTTKFLANLLENLLDWSRTQTGRLEFNPKYLKLSKIHQSIFALFSNSFSDKKIHFLWDDADLEVYADEILLNTVIRNLVGNALKFTPENGKILFVAEKVKEGVNIKISDSGIGMSEDVANKLFRIDMHHSSIGLNEEKGTGLGLLICKEFIEKHGGEITVESKIGTGTTFQFLIPSKSNT